MPSRYALRSLALGLPLLASCALAPFHGTRSAHSLGKEKMQLETGASPAPFVSFARGMTEDLDLGILVEQQLAPVGSGWARYSFINHPLQGASLAMTGGAFLGLDAADTTGFFAGPVASYRSGIFEAHLLAKVNYVHWSDIGVWKDDDLLGDFTIDSETFRYLHYQAGVSFWLSSSFAIHASGFVVHAFESERGKRFTGLIPQLSCSWDF